MVGFSGSKIFCLNYFSLTHVDIPQVRNMFVLCMYILMENDHGDLYPQSVAMIQYLERKNYKYDHYS